MIEVIEKVKDQKLSLLTQEMSATTILGIGVGLSQLSQIIIGMTDTVMMGWFGAQALAAGSLVNSLFLLLFLFFTGVLHATAPMMGAALGQLRLRDISTTLNHGNYLAYGMTAIMALFALVMEPFLLLLGQQEQVVEIAKTYTYWLIPGFLPSLLFIVIRVFLTTVGDVVILGCVSLIGVFINGLTNYAFMFGVFGFPTLGAPGCAVGTSLTNTLMVVAVALLMRYRPRINRVVFWTKAQHFRPDLLRAILSLGLPIGFVLFSEHITFSGAGLIMGVLGTDQLAAFSITLQWIAVFYMLPIGFSHAATTRISLAIGQKDTQLIKQVFMTSIGLATIYGLICLVAMIMFDQSMVSLLVKEDLEQNRTVVEQATVFMRWAAVLQLINGLIVVCAGILRGFRETKTPMLLVFVLYWILGLGSAIILSTRFGSTGIWAGILFSFSVTLFGLILTLLSKMKDLPSIIFQISLEDQKVFSSF
ncbi:MAG: MATE family efflux transporter [Desmonostoc vinosum HA7617-LM4]|nr:MATE family efflux transporter [Desmonostoc vinosum HA7617-LM4]